jgi:hypothetical protein
MPRANVFMKTESVGVPGITTLGGTSSTRVAVHAGMA